MTSGDLPEVLRRLLVQAADDHAAAIGGYDGLPPLPFVLPAGNGLPDGGEAIECHGAENTHWLQG